MYIGIDFGIINIVVFYVKRKVRGGVELQVMRIIQFDEYNSLIQEEILFLVFFLDFDGNIVIGKKVKYMKQYYLDRIILNSKWYMGIFMVFCIEDRVFILVDVVVNILKVCKRIIEFNFGGKFVQQVIIIVLVLFNIDQIRDM